MASSSNNTMAYTDFDSAQNAREEAARSKRRNVRVYLIRHAESEANLRKGEIGGRQNDVNLSDKGILQAKLLGRRLRAAGTELDEIHSSVANRASATAQLACHEMGIPTARINMEASIVEQSQGSWERVDRKTVYTPEVLAEMNRTNWTWAAPGCSSIDGAQGESQRDVEVRMMAFLESLLDRPAVGAGEESNELDGPINTVIEKVHFEEQGTLREIRVSPVAKRLFCSGCGALVGMDYDERHTLWFSLGLLGDDSAQALLEDYQARLDSGSSCSLSASQQHAYPPSHVFCEEQCALAGFSATFPALEAFGHYVQDSCEPTAEKKPTANWRESTSLKQQALGENEEPPVATATAASQRHEPAGEVVDMAAPVRTEAFGYYPFR